MNNLHKQLQELKNQSNLYTKEYKTFEEQLQKLIERNLVILNTTFEDIIKLYYFDTELRKIIFEAIEVVEIYLRTQIAYYHSQKY